MKGTEKQIKWATEIRNNVIDTLSKAKEEMQKRNNAAGASQTDERIAALESVEYAGDFIDVFGRIRFTGETIKDFQAVAAAYKITVGYDAMLCKNSK